MNIDVTIDKLKNSPECERTYKLLSVFKEKYPEEKEVFVAHAPGRVNLIGEHIDYNGYAVMPMSINREIEVAFVPLNEPRVEICSATSENMEREFLISDNIKAYDMGDWGNYVKAPCEVLYKWALGYCEDCIPLKGFKGVLIGDIPYAAGLSSSSALVVCIGTIINYINNLSISKSKLADLMAKGELYVGTMGGGMDQSASIFGHKDGPLRIMFRPIRVEEIKMSQGVSFIIANSLKKAEKTGAARFNFNTRSIECKLGLEILKNLAKDVYPESVYMPSIRRFQKLVGWDHIMPFFDKIPKHGLSIEEVSKLSGLSVEDITEKFLLLNDNVYLPIPKDGFKIADRLEHVFCEAKRVSLAKKAMIAGKIDLVAQYMDESHNSCRDLYDISCPEVEELIKCLKNAGTLGSRITGAGWGGCTVSIVKTEDADRIIKEIWETYYKEYALPNGLAVPEEKDLSKAIFACSPAEGAGIREEILASDLC